MSNDRLKFRAWDKKGKCMVDWMTMCQTAFNGDYDFSLMYMIMTNHTDQFEVMQWTGLYDSEGVEIYSGDLLRYPPKNSWDKENFAIHEVFYHDGDMAGGPGIGYRMCRIHYHGSLAGGYIPEFLPRNTERMVVAGNIHENPDLMERANG